MTCHKILFDLDGVLVDSLGLIERILRAWAAEHELDGDRAVALSHGRRDIDVVRLIAPHLDAAAEARRIVEREERDIDGLTAARGAAGLLAALPPGRWAVVTSGTRAVARARLAAAGLPEPAVLVAADDIVHGKPHPEGYLTAAGLLDAVPERCVVVEDAAAGVRAAAAAGMRCIGVGPALSGADDQLAAHVAGLHRVQVAPDGAGVRLSWTS
ncbi:HAD family hydrolase [Jiangella asiatica]|uniref:HAD family hydrolase n=2 Tax=Jiangella asiatica TaxID=2530372 RepID=A0A4R5CL61_9ACTN|nr:HAD family hydrolase [Jiangella asiatica]